MGQTAYATFEDYLTGYLKVTEEQFDSGIEEQVTDSLKFMLICQAIADKENMTYTIDDAKEYYLNNGSTEEDFNNRVANYGTGYVVQQYMDTKVIDLLLTRVIVNQ